MGAEVRKRNTEARKGLGSFGNNVFGFGLTQREIPVGVLRMILLLVAFFVLACGLCWFSVQLVGDNILGLRTGWSSGALMAFATILAFGCACGPKGGVATALHLLFGLIALLVFGYMLAEVDFRQVMPWPGYFMGSLGIALVGHFLPRDPKTAVSVDTSDLNVDLMD
jgi:hypothetical protein